MRSQGNPTGLPPALLGWAVPTLLVLAIVALVPGGYGAWMGISLRNWLLFACAPVASLSLALAYGAGRPHTPDDEA